MLRKNRNRIREGSRTADVIIYAIAFLFGLVCVYPIYYVLILSLSAPEYAITMKVYLWPKGLNLNGYRMLLRDSRLWMAYRNTVMYAASQTLLVLTTASLAGYALSARHLKFRKFVNYYLLIPMYFGGGIIPLFLLITQMGFYNTPWALILPGSFSIWYTILVRSYFRTIPESLREAASIDGAGHYRILLNVYLPNAKPILAVIALYTIVNSWNAWYRASIFISSRQWQPLQIYLRQILVEQTVTFTDEFITKEESLLEQAANLTANQMKYTVIIVSTLPMLIAYPFFQRYFVKGVMMGSLKE